MIGANPFPEFIHRGELALRHLVALLRSSGEPKGRLFMILRQAEGTVTNYTLNFREILKGPRSEPFYLKPADVVYVPEKFSWF